MHQSFRGGWYVTSDLARVDNDGYVHVLGRADDCFKSEGVLIAPGEVEAAILALGSYQEASVFPLPNREIGNRIGAALVLRAGSGAPRDAKSLRQGLDGCIAPFKLPQAVLPRTCGRSTNSRLLAPDVEAVIKAAIEEFYLSRLCPTSCARSNGVVSVNNSDHGVTKRLRPACGCTITRRYFATGTEQPMHAVSLGDLSGA
jgi:acyl-CoA synthetase (AMP-forming)/AMP-acid ligase II